MFYTAAKRSTVRQYSPFPLTGETLPNRTDYPVHHAARPYHHLGTACESLYSAYNSGQSWVRDIPAVADPASRYSSQGPDTDWDSGPAHAKTGLQTHLYSCAVSSDAQLPGFP